MKSLLIKPLFGLIALICLPLSFNYGQSINDLRVRLNWDDKPVVQHIGEDKFIFWHFDGAIHNSTEEGLPTYSTRIPLPKYGDIKATIQNPQSESFNTFGQEVAVQNNQPTIQVNIEQERNQFFARIEVFPVYLSGGSLQRLTAFDVSFDYTPKFLISQRDVPTYVSKLSDGDIYKFSIEQSGIHRLDYNFLKELGIPVDNINPKNIQLLGNGGAMVPELLSTNRIDDLAENPILVVGEDDNSFDASDYLLFYGEGPHVELPVDGKQTYTIERNVYEDKAYYFIKIGSDTGKRISNQPSLSSDMATYTTSEYMDCQRHELDKYNLLNQYTSAEGSGREWVGELFKNDPNQVFTGLFDFSDYVAGKEAYLDGRFIARSLGASVSCQVSSEGVNHQFSISEASSTTLGIYARAKNFLLPISLQSSNPSVTINYISNNADGWLGHLQINAYRKLIFGNTPVEFGISPDTSTLHTDYTSFQIANPTADMEVWEITEPTEAIIQDFSIENNQGVFTAAIDTTKRYVAFDRQGSFLTASPIGKIDNQNVHGTTDVDMVIIYHKSLESQAIRLADHREMHSGLAVALVDVELIYNEFSSGRKDPTGIRDFVKMVYDRDANFKYLLLFGDGSFDPKNITENANNLDMIVVRETPSSFDPINSGPSDDFYALLSPGEGTVGLTGALDIAVGRFPVDTPDEADAVVNKIINYETNPATLGSWRNHLVFIGDDEDGKTHMRQANELSEMVESTYPSYNPTKVHLDAYAHVSSPYGVRIPEAAKQIDESINSGSLVVNYFGHGGARGLAQERVVTLESIDEWNQNYNRLPLIITASCSTAGFDDPGIKTLGEELVIDSDGGAMALFSTTRPVYSHSNEKLIDAVYPQIFIKDDHDYRAIGEMLRIGKNGTSASISNTRKFSLLGDPAMKLALPKHQVHTDTINGKYVGDAISDTIKALQKVTIQGHVTDSDSVFLSGFSGVVDVTIFDKRVQLQTLGHGGQAVFEYQDRKGIFFKGSASVKEGQFTISFIVPADAVGIGLAKISYYVSDLVSEDGSGSFNGLVMGGSGSSPVTDDTPPVVEVFMNDEHFVDGGITDANPVIYAKISDDSGINISGSGIGHDLTASMDDESYIVNDYYEASRDDYTSGILRYPLKDVLPGLHEVVVKAWDVANNSGEGHISFIVSDTEEGVIKHLLTYPNPMTESTTFRFEHNFGEGPIEAHIQVYSMTGQLVKTIRRSIDSSGYRVDGIEWAGTSDNGGILSKGVYVYQVTLTQDNAQNKMVTSEFEKLVILK